MKKKTQTLDDFRKWFLQSGYPLEMRTARMTRKYASTVVAAAHVPVPERQARRPLEIDILAGDQIADAEFRTEYRFAIECKGHDEAFCAIAPPHVPGVDDKPDANDRRRYALMTTAMLAAVEVGEIFDVAKHHAVGFGVSATSAQGTAAIEGLYAACERADAFLQTREAQFGPPCAAIIIPVLLWRSPIFLASLSDHDEVVLEEIPTCVVSWTGFNGEPIDVFVVRETAYEEWLSLAQQHAHSLYERLRNAVNECAARIKRNEEPKEPPTVARLRAREEDLHWSLIEWSMKRERQAERVGPTGVPTFPWWRG